MATVRDIIKGSLRLIGAIATGETPTAEEQADALYTLNEMLDSWSTESLLVYNRATEKFDIVTGQQSYTMGASGDFNTTKPTWIDEFRFETTSHGSTLEFPIEMLNRDQWAAISMKETESTIPTKGFAQDTHPYQTIQLWPVPSATGKLIIHSWKPLAEFASAATTVDLPAGYAKALRYNLAVELAPEYGKEPSMTVLSQAMESKENIKRVNIKPLYLAVDSGIPTGRQGFNILTGE